MTAHAVRSTLRDGIGWSIVDLGGIRHLFAVADLRGPGTFPEQLDRSLEAVRAAFAGEGAERSIIQQSVFLDDPGRIEACRQRVEAFYGPDLPATHYVPQPPCDGASAAVEAFGIVPGAGATIERPNPHVVLARYGGMTWVHCADVTPPQGANGVFDGASGAFHRMRALLDEVGAPFDRVLRTWLYLGGIVAREGETLRYHELNRARADFYQHIPFLTDLLPAGVRGPVYPASTGIGAEGRGLALGALAVLADRKDVAAVPLENPRQTAAYEYDACHGLKSPKFSRAMALVRGREAVIFVSGTASITHSETRHVGAASAQTRETLENIAALISEENLRRHGLPGFGASLRGMGWIRVYVKRREDYPTVRAICEEAWGDLPAAYVLADVCRPELLVEIEAAAFSHSV